MRRIQGLFRAPGLNKLACGVKPAGYASPMQCGAAAMHRWSGIVAIAEYVAIPGLRHTAIARARRAWTRLWCCAAPGKH